MANFGNELDNIVIRAEKGQPLTSVELDNNFKYLRSFAANLTTEVSEFSLETSEIFSFGTDNKFSLGTSADGLSLVVQSKFEEDDDPIFVVKNNANQNVLEVLPDGNIQAPLGSFQIDATQLDNLDLSNFDNLQTQTLQILNYGSIAALEAALPDQASGTLAFAGGELMIKKD